MLKWWSEPLSTNGWFLWEINPEDAKFAKWGFAAISELSSDFLNVASWKWSMMIKIQDERIGIRAFRQHFYISLRYPSRKNDLSKGHYTPGKLTCRLRNSGLKTTFRLRWPLFRGHVRFWGDVYHPFPPHRRPYVKLSVPAIRSVNRQATKRLMLGQPHGEGL